MSLEAFTWALKKAPVDDAQTALVLMGLADHVGEDGRGAYPSQKTLARYARCSDRTVRRKLDDLEAAGLIVRGDQELVAHFPSYTRPVVWDLMLHIVRATPGQIDRGSGSDPRTSTTHPRTPTPGTPGHLCPTNRP